MNKKEKFEVKCFDLDEYGRGKFLLGKKEFSCFNLLKKEVAIVEKQEFFKQVNFKVSKLLKKSSDRVDVKCDVYNRCGSCHLLHMRYEEQIKVKENYVINALKKYNLNSKIDEVIESKIKDGYRNKMQFTFRYKDRDLVFGFYEENSHKVVNLDYCLIHSKEQNQIAKAITQIIKDLKLSIYDEDKRKGFIRFVVIRENKLNEEKEFLVTIVTNEKIFPAKNEFIKRLLNKCNYITTIIQNINTRKTSIILSEEEVILYGKGYTTEKLCDISFNISSRTFFQINTHQAQKLFEKVIELSQLKDDMVVVDAYSGIGTIGLILANKVKYVLSVENNKQSVLNARINAKNNSIRNIKFINDDATDYLVELSKSDEKIDLLILDPPRTGSTPKFLEAVKKLKPNTVIYISCEATTLARDLNELVSDYKIEKKVIVDMFVQTYHIETIVKLTKILKKN